MKILIVDDDWASRIVVLKTLQDYGRCDEVIDGFEAIDAFLEGWRINKPYDLIVLDIMMPRLGGLETLRIIRRMEINKGVNEWEKANILMTTVLNDTETVRAAFEAGCQAYAAKPLDISSLHQLVKKFAINRNKNNELKTDA